MPGNILIFRIMSGLLAKFVMRTLLLFQSNDTFSLTFKACRSVSTTIDPFWDISLDLPANNILPNGKSGSSTGSVIHSGPGTSSINPIIGGNGSKTNISTIASGPSISLHECLQRFTKPEHLGSTAKIKCSTCNAYQVNPLEQ